MRAASGMTRSLDQRRPRALSDNQIAEARRHPEVRLLLRIRKRLAKTIRAQYGTISRTRGTVVYDSYQEACRKYQSKIKAVRKALMAEEKKRYRKQQPIADIEIQLNDRHVECKQLSRSAPHEDLLSKERRRVVAALFTFASADVSEECKRRSEAINALIALSQRQERAIPKVCHSRHDDGVSEFAVRPVPSENTNVAASPTVSWECQPTQCIFCLGQKSLRQELRVKTFRSRGDLKKHFHRKHLRHHPDDQPIKCPHPMCNLTLRDKAHLQNHAAIIHGTLT